MEVVTKSAEETFKLGQKLGSSLKAGSVLALVGDLGAGKTTFIQGLAKGLGVTHKIVSPTFILLRQYGNFYHLDLYRLEENVENQVRELGLFDILQDPKNTLAIEWAERIKNLLPKNTTWIEFENIDDNERRITINETLH